LCSCAHPFVEFSLVLGDCCFLLIYLVRKLRDPLWIDGRIAYGRFDAPCVYRKLKHGRSGDEVRPGWRVT